MNLKKIPFWRNFSKIFNFRTWFLWLVAHGAAIILAYLLHLLFIQLWCLANECRSNYSGSGFFILASFGTLLGSFQWFVLKRVINPSKWWSAATMVGGALAFILILLLGVFTIILAIEAFPNGLEHNLSITENDSALIAGLFVGSVVGLAYGLPQWLVQRKHPAFSSVWILLNMIGYSLGFGFIVWESSQGIFYDNISALALSREQHNIIFLSLAILVPAAITGIYIASMEHRPNDSLEGS